MAFRDNARGRTSVPSSPRPRPPTPALDGTGSRHSTMRAALTYRHATCERNCEIASAMDRRIALQSGTKAAQGMKAGGRKEKDERPER